MHPASYTLVNITTAAELDLAGPRLQASATGLATLLTQVIVLPAPILAGWVVQHYGYGAAFSLAAAFTGAGALVMLPVRLYRGVGKLTPASRWRKRARWMRASKDT
jgi:hypothetical protein